MPGTASERAPGKRLRRTLVSVYWALLIYVCAAGIYSVLDQLYFNPVTLRDPLKARVEHQDSQGNHH